MKRLLIMLSNGACEGWSDRIMQSDLSGTNMQTSSRWNSFTIPHFQSSCRPSISIFISPGPLPANMPGSLTAHLPPSLSTPYHTACMENSFPVEVEHEIRLACRCKCYIGRKSDSHGLHKYNILKGTIRANSDEMHLWVVFLKHKWQIFHTYLQ